MTDTLRIRVSNHLDRARALTLPHMPRQDRVRFDYDCRLYREGTIDDVIRVAKHSRISNRRILDIGCGLGSIPYLLGNLGFNVQGLDIRGTADYYDHLNMTSDDFAAIWRNLESSCPNVEYRFYSPVELPFEDSSFDDVLYYASLEHMPFEDAPSSLEESRRVLKPDGNLFIFRCPSALSWTERTARKLGIPGHDLLYEEGTLTQLIENTGFRITEMARSDLFPAFLPVNLQWMLDMHTPWLFPLQGILLKTFFRRWAHHFRVIAQKI